MTLLDVRVEPAREHGSITGGGGFAAGDGVPDWALTLRNGIPDTTGFVASDGPARKLAGEYVWGGAAMKQPGHFVAEHAPRLLLSARERPDATVLFLLPKDTTADELSDWFWEVVAWLGIERERVEFVAGDPVVVESLTVFPQGEHLTGIADDLDADRTLDPTGLPTEAYLEALDVNVARNGLAPIENDIVYVSRAGTATPLGGEEYLEGLLIAAGVRVIRPELHRVEEQLALFAGAHHLVFAEGSALHFRQLIGYEPQTITVLQRRPARKVGHGPLLPRVDRLNYVSVINGMALGSFDRVSGVPVGYAAFPHTDPERLLRVFSDLGLDLSADWDPDAFRACFERDLFAWAGHVRSISRTSTLRYALNALASLIAVGEPPHIAEAVAHTIEPERPLNRLQDVALVEQQRDAQAARAAQLQAQLESIRGSASLKLGRALLAPGMRLHRWYSRRGR